MGQSLSRKIMLGKSVRELYKKSCQEFGCNTKVSLEIKSFLEEFSGEKIMRDLNFFSVEILEKKYSVLCVSLLIESTWRNNEQKR